MSAEYVEMRAFHLAFFFFNDTATTEIYTLSLHDALPIYTQIKDIASLKAEIASLKARQKAVEDLQIDRNVPVDRKSTRLNSSHLVISYAVFCLKKKKRITR